jgi:hypothetical protein
MILSRPDGAEREEVPVNGFSLTYEGFDPAGGGTA